MKMLLDVAVEHDLYSVADEVYREFTMRAYSKKRRRSSQKARSREKEYRDRYWLRKFHEMQAASGGGKDGWNGKTE